MKDSTAILNKAKETILLESKSIANLTNDDNNHYVAVVHLHDIIKEGFF